MEIKDLILLLWRNFRYVALGLFLGACVGIAAAKFQVPVYEATTKVYVSRARQQSNADMLSLNDEQLMAINLQLAKSQPVLNEVIAQLGSKVSPDSIEVSAIPNTLIIQIKVEDTDPQRAATIANLLVQTLVQQNETILSGWYTATENSLTEQLAQVQAQITGLETQIDQINDAGIQEQLTQVNQQMAQLNAEVSTLEREIASFSDFLTPLESAALTEKRAQLDRLNSLLALYQQVQTNLTYIGKPVQNGLGLENPQLATLQSTLNLYKQINATLINNRETVRLARAQSKQIVMQIVPATPPKNQVRPIPNLYILLGCLVGFMLVVIAILMVDHFDESIKTASQIENLLGLPVLGVVFDNGHPGNGLVTLDDPFSVEADAFRTLGAGLEIIGAGKSIRTLMIVNAQPSDARKTIAANWAIVHAKQGSRVILMDGDLKHPHLHSLFGMENKEGLAELLNNRLDTQRALHPVQDMDGLILIPGGMAEKDGKAWMNAEQWKNLLNELREQADLLIVDGPSADVADALILAAEVNAVLLAVSSGGTHVETARTTLRRFQLIGANVVGAVLTQDTKHRTVKRRLLSWIKLKSEKKENAYEDHSETDDIHVSPSE
jgi:polysaccharide biosynthesis transport protein